MDIERRGVVQTSVVLGAATFLTKLFESRVFAQMATPTVSTQMGTPTPGIARETATTFPSPTVLVIPTARPEASVTSGPTVDVRTTPISTPTIRQHTPEPSPTVHPIPTAHPERSVAPGPAVLPNEIPTPTIARHEQATSTPRLITFEISTPSPVPTTPRPTDTAVPPTPEVPFFRITPSATPTVARETPTVPLVETPIVPPPTRVPTQTPPVGTPPAVGAEGYGTVKQDESQRNGIVLTAAVLTGAGVLTARRLRDPMTRRSIIGLFQRRRNNV